MHDFPEENPFVPAPPFARSAGPVADADDPDRPTSGFSRRRFLALAGGMGAVGALGVTLGPRAWDSLFGGGTGTGGALGSSTGRTLVLLTLYGGNDGMNTVIPIKIPPMPATGASWPSRSRPCSRWARDSASTRRCPAFKKLWDAKQLAVVQGVGFANPNYSHFESMDIWQSGVPGTPVTSGWLGRWLDGTNASPLRALGIGPTLPTALTGEKVQGAAVPAGAFVLPGGRDRAGAVRLDGPVRQLGDPPPDRGGGGERQPSRRATRHRPDPEPIGEQRSAPSPELGFQQPGRRE